MSDEEAEEEGPDPMQEQVEVADPARAALEERRERLRKGLIIFEERWKTEHGRAPAGSDDLPFHVRANYREYADLKRQLRACKGVFTPCVHSSIFAEVTHGKRCISAYNTAWACCVRIMSTSRCI